MKRWVMVPLAPALRRYRRMRGDVVMAKKKTEPCRQTKYAQRVRQELRALLGGACELCMETDESALEFDHIFGRDYNLRKLSFSARMARYKREAEEGKLRILCRTCNLAARKMNDNGRHVPTASQVEVTADLF